jgi:hypothetical protein
VTGAAGNTIGVFAALLTEIAQTSRFGLTDFLYQRDGETIAFAQPDLAVSGTGSSSVAQVVDIQVMSAV